MARWTRREARAGRYRPSMLCDACGQPVGERYYSDEEVCGGSDGPGFYLCRRTRCRTQREVMTAEERRALYAAQRAKNGGSRPWR